MNSLERTLILKAGYDHGWEVVVEDAPAQVILASALHRAQVQIIAPPSGSGSRWAIAVQPEEIHRELIREQPGYHLSDMWLGAVDESALCRLLSQAARLARTLPDEPCHRFTKAVAEELAVSISATEVERLIRQRVGQNIYRESLMDYWGGACAVSGIAVPGLLRASHAKPWAECTTDAERLNVFNGFLLCAHLDALFDRHLMTFDAEGHAIFSRAIGAHVLSQLGIAGPVELRWVSPEHQPFLAWHQAAFESNPSRRQDPAPRWRD